MITVHFDGSCNPNPHGAAGYGSVIKKDGEIIAQLCDARAASIRNSNNVSEYQALLNAMDWLYERGMNKEKITFYGDSSLIINQMSGRFKKLPRTGLYAEIGRSTISKKSLFPNSSFVWIPREENTEADALSTMLVGKFVEQW